MRNQWAKNRTWNDEIERTFFRKLEKSANAREHLRCQASLLSVVQPRVALRLLELYFAFPSEDIDCLAFSTQGLALVALNELENAVESYNRALELELQQSSYRSFANLEYPLLVVTRNMFPRYVQAFEVSHRRGSPYGVTEAFEMYCARAIILNEAEERASARENSLAALGAAAALQAEGIRESGILTICGDYEGTIGRLKTIAKD